MEVVNINGEFTVDRRNEVVKWNLDLIDASNPNGQFEFTVPAMDPDSFFPVSVDFSSNKTFIDMSVLGSFHTQVGPPPSRPAQSTTFISCNLPHARLHIK